MNSKIGIFSVLVLGVMMLLIPTSSLANAQEYDSYYDEQNQYYDGVYRDDNYKKSDYENESYKKNDDRNDEPVIIIKNEPIQKKEKKKMKELPMLLVKKDVLYCDLVANGTNESCQIPIPGPDSERYVQECTADNFLCDITEDLFKIIVTDDVKFPGSEGTKINFNGERYTVTEDGNMGEILQNEFATSNCQSVGFDTGYIVETREGQDVFGAVICTLSEGNCSGIVQDGKLHECTIKNFVIRAAV